MINLFFKKNFVFNKNINNFFSIDDALFLVKKYSISNFDESVDLSIKLCSDFSKKSNNFIKDCFFFPYNVVKFNKLLFFDKSEDNFHILKSMGIINYGNCSIINKIKNGFLNFSVFVTFYEYSYFVKSIEDLLSFNKIPIIFISNKDVIDFIYNYKIGQSCFKSNKYKIVNISLGKSSFNLNFLKSNLIEFLKFLNLKKPSDINKRFFDKIIISSTMGKSYKLILNDIYKNF